MKKDKSLIKIDKNALEIISKQGDSALIKPLQKEILLFESYISGTNKIDKEIIKNIKVQDKLILKIEENKFSDNEIIILNQDKKKIGYLDEKDSLVISRLMNAGKLLIAKVNRINKKGDFAIIFINIFLIDY